MDCQTTQEGRSTLHRNFQNRRLQTRHLLLSATSKSLKSTVSWRTWVRASFPLHRRRRRAPTRPAPLSRAQVHLTCYLTTTCWRSCGPTPSGSIIKIRTRRST